MKFQMPLSDSKFSSDQHFSDTRVMKRRCRTENATWVFYKRRRKWRFRPGMWMSLPPGKQRKELLNNNQTLMHKSVINFMVLVLLHDSHQPTNLQPTWLFLAVDGMSVLSLPFPPCATYALWLNCFMINGGGEKYSRVKYYFDLTKI